MQGTDQLTFQSRPGSPRGSLIRNNHCRIRWERPEPIIGNRLLAIVYLIWANTSQNKAALARIFVDHWPATHHICRNGLQIFWNERFEVVRIFSRSQSE